MRFDNPPQKLHEIPVVKEIPAKRAARTTTVVKHEKNAWILVRSCFFFLHINC